MGPMLVALVIHPVHLLVKVMVVVLVKPRRNMVEAVAAEQVLLVVPQLDQEHHLVEWVVLVLQVL